MKLFFFFFSFFPGLCGNQYNRWCKITHSPELLVNAARKGVSCVGVLSNLSWPHFLPLQLLLPCCSSRSHRRCAYAFSVSFLFLCPFVYLKICLFRILLALLIIPHLLLREALLWSLSHSWFLGNGSRSVCVKYHRIYDHMGGDLSLTLSILS